MDAQSSSDDSRFAEPADDNASFANTSEEQPHHHDRTGQATNEKRKFDYDGFIGDYADDSYDLSGELISIEETYKEMALYRKSGQSNDQLTNSLLTNESQRRLG